jgi:hypothetical protein
MIVLKKRKFVVGSGRRYTETPANSIRCRSSSQRITALFSIFSRQYGPAIQQFHTVLEMDPDFSRAQMITYAYVEEGRFPEAVQVIDRWKDDKNASWGWPMSG